MANIFEQFRPTAPAAPHQGDNPFREFAAKPHPEESSAPRIAPKPKARSWGEAIGDTAKDLASGVGGVIKGGGTLYGLATGDMDNAATRLGSSVQEYWQEDQSEQLKARKQARSESIDNASGIVGKAVTAIKETVKDPALAVSTVAESAASFIPAGAVGRVGAIAGGAQALAKGATAAQAAARAVKVGTAAAVGTGAVQQGADVAGGAYEDAMAQSDETWTANPEYARRITSGEDAATVKHDLALAASRAAFVPAAAVSVGSQFIPGGATLERTVAGAAAKAGARTGIAARGVNALRGAVGEGAQEAIEEGAGQFAANVAQQEYTDPSRDLGEGVGESAGLGFVAGAGLGAGAGGAQRAAIAPRPQPMTEQTPMLALPAPRAVTVDTTGTATTAEQLNAQAYAIAATAQDRANLGLTPDVNRARARHPSAVPNTSPQPAASELRFPDATPGSLSDVANAIPAPLSAATETVAEPNPMAAEGATPLTEFEGAGPALSANGIANTDAARAPTDAELKTAINDHLNRLAEAGKGLNSPALKRELGVTSARLKPLMSEVRKERQLGATSPLQPAANTPESIPAVAPADLPVSDQDELSNTARALQPPRPSLATLGDPQTQASSQEPASEAGIAPIATPSEEAPETLPLSSVQAAAAEAATSPTNGLQEPSEAQKAASNFRVGRMKVAGLDVSIEHPAGTKRKPDHKTLTRAYGYFRRTVGKDKDHVDVFLGDRADVPSLPVFVIDQLTKDGKFDEAKVVMGEPDEASAREAYLSNYPDDWNGLGGITEMTQNEFKDWVKDPAKTQRRVSKAPRAPQTEASEPGAMIRGLSSDEPLGAQGSPGSETSVALPQTAGKREPDVLQNRASPSGRWATDRPSGSFGTVRQDDTPLNSTSSTPKVRRSDGKVLYVGHARETLEAYFQPGRIVKGYGGLDRVLGFEWNNGDWRVQVQHVDKDGNPLPNEVPRSHRTSPESRELRAVLGEPSQYLKQPKSKAAAAPKTIDMPAKPQATTPRAETSAVAQLAASEAPKPKTRMVGGRRIQVTPTSALTKPAARTAAAAGDASDAPSESQEVGAGTRTDTASAIGAGDTARRSTDLSVNPSTRLSVQPAGREEPGHGALNFERALQLKDQLTANWGDNAPQVFLVRDAEGFPDSAKADKDYRRAEGLYAGGQVVWINVGRIPSEQRFAEVLAHEALGHYGVEQVVGVKQWAGIVDAIERLDREGLGSPQTKQILADLHQKQPGLDRDAFAREVLAFMAEKGQRNALIGQLVAAVRRFLRRVMPNLQWQEADIRGLLGQAESFLRSSRKTVATNAPGPVAFAVDRSPSEDLDAGATEVNELAIDQTFVAGLSPIERHSPAIAGLAKATWDEMGTASPFFRQWFGDSKVVNSDGQPLKAYHGTAAEFDAFDPARAGKSTGHMTARLGMFFDARRDKAEHYARIASNDVPAEQQVLELYLAIQNPYSMTKAEFMGIDSTEAAATLRARLEREGFDGIRLPEIGQWIAFHPEQVKSTGNRGTFNRGDVRMLWSKAAATTPDTVQTDSFAHLSDHQRAALSKIATFAPREAWREKAKRLTERWQQKLVQGVFDQFAPLKALDETAYMQARLSKGTDGAVEAAFRFGPPTLTDGALDVSPDGKGLQGILQDLAGEQDLFFAWMAGHRAQALKADGREHLFTDDEIEVLTQLSRGKMADGRPRPSAYAAAQRAFNRYQRAVLDVAEEAGILDPEHRQLWTNEFYVPFYRVMEGEQSVSPGQVGGLVRQKAFERLKGGDEPLGDLLANTLTNWSHLLSTSMKNMAAARALSAAAAMGVATPATSTEKGTVWAMVEGKQQHYAVKDALVLDALTMLHHPGWNNPAMKGMKWFKRALTTGVTADPSFRIRNLLRDTVSAIASNEIGYNPLRNLVQGWKATETGGDTYLRLMGGGGAIRFGTLLDGDQAANAKRLIASGVKSEQILDTPQKAKAVFARAWDRWQELGDRAETVNRAVAYEHARAVGKNHLEASLAARDLLDFTMSGKWAAVRFLIQIVPFMNARLQGMYKLGRAAHRDPRRFGAVAGVVALSSVLLHLLNADDEDYRALPDWVRDTYWWVRMPGTEHALYIPKPFEIGALGSVAERATELMTGGDDYTARDFANTLSSIIGDQLAMNPTPQAIKPFMEAAFNRNTFQDRPIDSMGQERLPGADRYTARSSAGAVALGGALDYSPQRIEHMVRGYFGWLGTQALNVSDLLGRGIFDMPANPARDMSRVENMAVVGSFVRPSSSGAGNKYLTRFYDQQNEVDQLYASYSAARQAGDFERARELAGDDRLRLRALYSAANVHMTKINQRIRQVTNDRSLSAARKAELLDGLHDVRNRLAEQTTRRARASAD